MLRPDTPFIKILLDEWRQDIERYEAKEGHNTGIVNTNKYRIRQIYEYLKTAESYVDHLEKLLSAERQKTRSHKPDTWDGIGEAQKHVLSYIQREGIHPEILKKTFHKEAKRQISINLAKQKWADHYE